MKKIKLLLVDDEENFVNTLAERMKMRDVPSKVVFNGEQALEAVQTDTPDVMVLDLRMPGIDGMDVLRKVRKTHPNVQVIILTGHGTDLDEEEAKQLGAFHYHKKPIDIDALLSTVKKADRERSRTPWWRPPSPRPGNSTRPRRFWTRKENSFRPCSRNGRPFREHGPGQGPFRRTVGQACRGVCPGLGRGEVSACRTGFFLLTTRSISPLCLPNG
jgi:DNA-binding response OmpR family regulator